MIIVIIFLIGCAVPFIPSDRFWPISFFGLVLPYFFFLSLIFLLFWVVFNPKYCLVSLIPMLIGWKSIAAFFAFHANSTYTADPANSMTVMSYNVRYFKDFTFSTLENAILRGRIMSLIKENNPDILCLQEFYTVDNSTGNNNIHAISEEMNLPYTFFNNAHSFQDRHAGVALFSKYPIIRTVKVGLTAEDKGSSAIAADIVKNKNDTFRVITFHLQSIYLNRRDLQGLQKLMHQEDTGLVASKVIVGKLRKAFLKRDQQANTISGLIRESPYPVIVCGDFNDTPNSYAYFKIRGNLQDAFLKKGFGLGRTYSAIAPTLRIDYILTSPSFTIRSFRCIRKILSDHYPVVSTMTPDQ